MYTASHRKTDQPTIYTKGEVKFIVVPHQREQSLPVFSGLLLVTFAAIETGSRVSLFTPFRVVCRGSRQGGVGREITCTYAHTGGGRDQNHSFCLDGPAQSGWGRSEGWARYILSYE